MTPLVDRIKTNRVELHAAARRALSRILDTRIAEAEQEIADLQHTIEQAQQEIKVQQLRILDARRQQVQMDQA